jgi:molecular chaperone GrpE
MVNDMGNTPTDDATPEEPAEGVPDTNGGASAAASDAVATLQAELEKAQAQVAEYLEGWQRARAEFTNYRRRIEAERDEIRCRSNESLLLRLLPVVDDFERALQAVPDDLASSSWVSGVTMILSKLHALLDSESVAPVSAVGQLFDPQYHEAMMQEQTTDHPDGTVIEELRKGYRIGDRVLRPALVKVASNSAQPSTPPTNSQNAVQA